MKTPEQFIPFTTDISSIAMPEKFTFPFSYVPHELCVKAAFELQQEINKADGWGHNYGFDNDQEGKPVGKMFGVLVVRCNGKIGYLTAFSGKLADSNLHADFVPPVYDRLEKDGFYAIGETELDGINERVRELGSSKEYEELKTLLRKMQLIVHDDLAVISKELKNLKRGRQKRRQELGENITEAETKELIKQSLDQQFVFKSIKKRVNEDVAYYANKVQEIEGEIQALKALRKKKSGELQNQLFQKYQFLNADGNSEDVLGIFKDLEKIPPAGAGDCAAPKLLQFAYQNGMQPIAMAEFWWGISPKKEIRKHGEFYPSCRVKCEPILGHMLKGLDVEPNPILLRDTSLLKIETVYEDDHMAVISKPAGLLSTPGKTEYDSVQSRMKTQFPEATGPLIVHRLDMATSGLLLIAKNEVVYKALQHQFLTKEIRKRYSAVLDGELKENSGEIDLPLRVDFDNRPHQLVCYEYGKAAKTKWELLEVKDGKSKVYFYPITGRTHQLRVHAAHPKGLNMSIVGDVLYGTPADRLYLHAEWISFIHPITKERKEVELIGF